MTFNATESFTLPQELFGSLMEDIQPSDQPVGSSPRNNDVFFLPGGVFTRPALKGLFASTGSGKTISTGDFRLASGEWNILTLDDQGNLYAADAITGSRTFLFQTAGLCRQHYASYGNFLFVASSGVGTSPNPWATKQSGFDIPAYWNGSSINRVTSDAPPPPTVQPAYIAPATVQQNSTMATLTISAYATASPQPSDRGTAYGEIIYTCTAPVSSSLLGNWVSISGLTGPYADYANISGTIIAVNGSTFTVGGLWFFSFSATGQSGTGTVGASSIYATRSGNYVKAYLGSTLPANYQRGFWVSLTDSSGNPVSDTPSLIASMSRASTGIVTVTMEYPWTNLPPGAVVYISPPNAAYSGVVAVTSTSSTITYVSGDAFDPNWAGQVIKIGSTNYVVESVSGNVIVLTTAYVGSSGTQGYNISYAAFGNPGFQTIYEAISSTVFTYQSLDTDAVSVIGGTGTAYFQWTQMGGTYGNAAQITDTGIDSGGAYVRWFQLGPDESLTLGAAPILTLVGQASPGTHQFALFYENGDGQQTAPSTIISAEAAGNGQVFLFSNLPIGPNGTTARIVAATAAGGDSFFYLSPGTTASQDGNGPSIITGTEIQDNTTIGVTIDFSDATLLAGEEIDVTGNNLFAQVRLDPCCGVFSYSSRLAWWGEINNRKNMQNLGFDAGFQVVQHTITMTAGSNGGTGFSPSPVPSSWVYGTQVTVGGVPMVVASHSSTGIVFTTLWAGGNGTFSIYALLPEGAPPYWDGSEGDGTGTLVPGDRFGGFFYRMPTGGNAQIQQGVYRDQFGGTILEPNTAYYFRILARVGTVTYGNLNFRLHSPSGSAPDVNCALNISSFTTEWGWYSGTFNTPITIPSDYVGQILLSSTSSGTWVDIDEPEMIPQSQPVLDTQLRVSYAENPFGYDGVTGIIVPLGMRAPLAGLGQLREYLYLVDELDLRETQDTNSGEPSSWTLKLIDQNCGCSSPWAITASEDWLEWSGRHGVRFFDGNPETRKINQELARTWETIQWADPMSMWAAADPVQRQTYFGIKTNSADNTADVLLVLNYRLADSTYNVPDPVHISTYSGKMLATDLGRKWTKWYREIPCGASVSSNPYGLGVAKNFLFGGSTQQRIYYLDVLNYPPLNGDQTLSWNPIDDDFGGYESEYLTSPFYPRELEANPAIGSYRKLYSAISFHATGFTGEFFTNVTAYMDSLDCPSIPFPLFQLDYPDQGYDLSLGINVVCERMFLGFSSPSGSAFGLTELAVSGRMDMVFPMRGSL